MDSDRSFLIIGKGSVNWNARLFVFNDTEEQVFDILLREHLSGIPPVRWSDIKEEVDSGALRLKRIFLHGKKVNSAWGTLIVRGPGRGTYQLGIDPDTDITGRDGEPLVPKAPWRPCSPSVNGTLTHKTARFKA